MIERPIRAPLLFDGQAWRVPLPTYTVLPGSFSPVVSGVSTPDGPLATADPTDPKLTGASVMVMVPVDDLNAAQTAIAPAVVRRRYGRSAHVMLADPRYDPQAPDAS